MTEILFARLDEILSVTGTPAQGDMIFWNGTQWIRLAAGASGQVLTAHGAGTNPTWTSQGFADGNHGDITTATSGTVWTINAQAVTYAKIQNVSATSRFLGRITAGAGVIEELTGTQATSLLNQFTAGLQGLVSASGGGSTNFLRADNTWAVPQTSVALVVPAEFSVAGSPVTSPSGTLTVTKAVKNQNLVYAGPTTGAASAPTFRSLVAADLPQFTSTLVGAVSASGGGTTNFLRADNTWAVPALATPGGSVGQLQWNNSGVFAGVAVGGDATFNTGTGQFTVANQAITYAKIQNVSATSRFLGRITAGAGTIEELTGTQATSLLNVFTLSANGLVPASGGGSTNFLRADGAWAAPPTGGGGGTPGGLSGNVQFNNAGAFGGLTDVQLTARIQNVTSSLSGAAPASGGGTANFLRADATWAVPPGTTVPGSPTNSIQFNSASTFAGSANLTWDGTNLLVGTSSSQSFVLASPIVQSIATGTGAGFGTQRYSADAGGARLHFGKSRGASIGTQGLLSSGDTISDIRFDGSDGVVMQPAAAISVQIDGTAAANNMPSRIQFFTNSGTTSITEAARFDKSGHFILGGVASQVAANLQIHGTTVADASTAAIGRFSADATGGNLNFYKSRGGSVGAQTITATNDVIGNIQFFASDGANFIGSSFISGVVDGTPSAGIAFGALSFGVNDGGGGFFEVMKLNNVGELYLHGDTPKVVLNNGTTAVFGSAVQVLGTNGGTGSAYIARSTNGSGNVAPRLFFAFSKGGTWASHGAVAQDNYLGEISFQGDDGTVFTAEGAKISVAVDGAVTTSNVPGRMMFQTANTTGGGVVERMRIDHLGQTNLNVEGTLAGSQTVDGSTMLFQTTATSAPWGMSQYTYGNHGGNQGFIQFKSRTATPGGARTILVNGDRVMDFRASGDDGTGFVEMVSIQGFLDGNASADTVPGRLEFATATTNSRITRVSIDSAGATHFFGKGVNGQSVDIQSITEQTTIAAAATTTTGIQIPANALVIGVSVRVTTVIPTATTFTVTAGGKTFNTAAVSTAVNTTDPGTAAGINYFAAATSITITPNLTPAAATGVVRTTIHYITITPPTS